MPSSNSSSSSSGSADREVLPQPGQIGELQVHDLDPVLAHQLDHVLGSWADSPGSCPASNWAIGRLSVAMDASWPSCRLSLEFAPATSCARRKLEEQRYQEPQEQAANDRHRDEAAGGCWKKNKHLRTTRLRGQRRPSHAQQQQPSCPACQTHPGSVAQVTS